MNQVYIPSVNELIMIRESLEKIIDSNNTTNTIKLASEALELLFGVKKS